MEGMALDVTTNDAAALTDSDLDELASMEEAFSAGQLSKAKEDWVLITTARIERQAARLHLLHAGAHRRHAVRAARPDERQALVQARPGAARADRRGLPPGAHGVPRRGRRRRLPLRQRRRPRGVQGPREVTPSPGTTAVGEERAWGRRLAKRFGIEAKYDPTSFTSTTGAQSGYLDHESSKPDKLDPAVVEMFSKVPVAKGGVMVVYGWTMAEDLVKLGRR